MTNPNQQQNIDEHIASCCLIIYKKYIRVTMMVFSLRRIQQLMVVVLLLIAVKTVQSSNTDDEESLMSTTTAAVTKSSSSSFRLRSLWKAWTSSTPGNVQSTTPTTSTTATTTTTSTTNNNVRQEKCQLCHDGSYPKNQYHGVVVSFHSFSFTGTCSNLYYELQNRPVYKNDAICNPLQDRFDWTCGCNPNYVVQAEKPNTVNLGTGYGSWGGW